MTQESDVFFPNIDELLAKLPDGSFAAELVVAAKECQDMAEARSRMEQIVKDRLDAGRADSEDAETLLA